VGSEGRNGLGNIRKSSLKSTWFKDTDLRNVCIGLQGILEVPSVPVVPVASGMLLLAADEHLWPTNILSFKLDFSLDISHDLICLLLLVFKEENESSFVGDPKQDMTGDRCQSLYPTLPSTSSLPSSSLSTLLLEHLLISLVDTDVSVRRKKEEE
jgi:hypothetical protein